MISHRCTECGGKYICSCFKVFLSDKNQWYCYSIGPCKCVHVQLNYNWNVHWLHQFQLIWPVYSSRSTDFFATYYHMYMIRMLIRVCFPHPLHHSVHVYRPFHMIFIRSSKSNPRKRVVWREVIGEMYLKPFFRSSLLYERTVKLSQGHTMAIIRHGLLKISAVGYYCFNTLLQR